MDELIYVSTDSMYSKVDYGSVPFSSVYTRYSFNGPRVPYLHFSDTHWITIF